MDLGTIANLATAIAVVSGVIFGIVELGGSSAKTAPPSR